MTLDDVYGSDLDRFPLEQESAWKKTTVPRLEWDDAVVTDVRENGPPAHLYAESVLASRRAEFLTVH